MVVTIMRNAGEPGRLQEWAEEFSLTHPVLVDTGGGYGDIGFALSRDGHTPSNHVAGPGAVLVDHEHRPTDEEIRALLGAE